MMGSIGSKLRKTSSLLLILLLTFSSCYKVSPELKPKLSYSVQDKYLKQLPSPFTPLTSAEMESDWGKEYYIGLQFARSFDLYRAITSLRRAEILIPPDSPRLREIEYEILLCYYLGRRFQDVEDTFTQSSLIKANAEFRASHDLLIILYDTYLNLEREEKAAQILTLIQNLYPQEFQKIITYTALKHGDLTSLPKPLLESYTAQEKSISKAGLLNALLPGAGYLYLGQKQTALTAFLVNGVFIAATVHFFMRGQIAAGILFASFEAGWYFGGIYGAKLEAKYYNERLYEALATPYMNKEGIFPIFMLKNGF